MSIIDHMRTMVCGTINISYNTQRKSSTPHAAKYYAIWKGDMLKVMPVGLEKAIKEKVYT